MKTKFVVFVVTRREGGASYLEKAFAKRTRAVEYCSLCKGCADGFERRCERIEVTTVRTGNDHISIAFLRLRPATDEEEREHGFRSLAGCWAEDRGDDDMEAIIRKGREGRRGSRIIPSFDE